MSKSSYLGANVEVTTDSFGGWIDKTNQVRHDMGTIVVTVGDVVQPNTTNGAETSGNAHVEGIFSATTLSAVDALTGGTVSVPATLDITSNVDFTSTNGTIDITSSINVLTVDANNVIVSSNVVFDGGATKIFLIDAANTVINTGPLYGKSNTYLSGTNTYITSTELKTTSNTIITGATVDIDGTTLDVTSNTIITSAVFTANSDAIILGNVGTDTLVVNSTSDFNANVNIDGVLTTIRSTNTMIGDAGTDQLNVNAVSDFNANVNIDGILTQTANATFTGALVNITGANTTIGDAGADKLNVNATSDFNANVNIDGVLTQTANATFTGALVNITGANTTVGNAGTDVFNVNAISSLKANVAITSTATAFTVAANTTLSGANVYITSANTTVGNAGTDRLNVNAAADFNANVNIDGILTQTANAVFSGALVNVTSANTTVGDAGSDQLNVNATAYFNANVNIDGILTQTANAVFTGALVNITGANTTIGDAGTDKLNVNAVTDFNANVNIDGVFTVTNTATFTGAETYFNNNVTLGATTADTVSILGYVDADVLPSATTVDLGSDAKPFGNVHTTYVWSDNNIDTLGDFVVRGSTARTLKTLSTNTGYQTFNLVLETSTANQKLPLVANSTGIHGGANTTYDLGSTTTNWNKLYVKDAAVANSAVVSNVLTVNSQANTASLMVRDLTATRVPYVSTGGEIVDSANLTFSGSTLALTGAATVSTNLSVGGNATVTGTATINTQANTASLMVRDLTPTRIVYAGTGGELVDSSNLTFSGSTLAVTGNTTVSANLSVTYVITSTNVVASSHVGAATLSTSGLATLNSLSVTGTATFNGNLDLQDNDKLLIGDSDDLQIFHDGLNSYIKDTGAGELIVDASTFRVMNAANTEPMMVATQNGAVSLYYDNALRIATTNTGASVSGVFSTSQLATLESASVTNGLTVNGLSSVVGAATFANTVTITGDLTVYGSTTLAVDVEFIVNDLDSLRATVREHLNITGNTTIGDSNTENSTAVTLYSKVVNDIIPNANNTYNIGSATAIYDTVYAENLVGNVAWSSITSKPDPVVTVTLTGDVTGTGSATLTDLTSGSMSFATTIQPNSVALGTDTTGNYVKSLAAGTSSTQTGSSGLTISATAGEGTEATIAHADTSSVANLAITNLNGNVLQDLSLAFDTYGHVTSISAASTNLDNRYSRVAFKTITVADIDSGYTWAETGSAVADGLTDTLKFVGGTDIDIDVDATNDAIRIQDTSTLSTVTGRGATTGSAISITNTTDSTSTTTGALKVSGGVGIAKQLRVGTTINVTGAATFANTASFANNVTIAGDLTVNGTTTTINSTTVTYDDKNLELGSITSPSDAGADGGGITLKGTTDKTFNWVNATDAWTSSEHMNLAFGKSYYINGTSVLNATTLGSGVTSSSLTSVGTLSTGTWSASTIAVNKGGTGQTTYTNGQLLIGNTTGNTLTKATLTAGNNITITNGSGAITIAATGGNTDLGYIANTSLGTVTSSNGDDATIPAANSTVAGLITTGAQTIAGSKTFSSNIVAPGISRTGDFTIDATGDIILDADGNDIRIKNGAGADTVTITLQDDANFVIAAPLDILLRPSGDTVYMQGTTNAEQLSFQLDTATQTITASDNLELDATGNITLDASGDIILDADAGQVYFRDAGLNRARFDFTSTTDVRFYAGTTLNTTWNGADTTMEGAVFINNADNQNKGLKIVNSAGEVGRFYFTSADEDARLAINYFLSGTQDLAITSTGKVQVNWNEAAVAAYDLQTGGYVNHDTFFVGFDGPNTTGSIVLGNENGAKVRLKGEDSGTIAIQADPYNEFGSSEIRFEVDGTERGSIDASGNLVMTGDITANSDARLKENVVTVDSALDKVSQMRGVYFNKIGEEKRSLGVIAQEIEEVLPEVVLTADDEEGIKSVAYGNIVGVLIEAIKELKAEIEELKSNKTQ
jgi:mucin-19